MSVTPVFSGVHKGDKTFTLRVVPDDRSVSVDGFSIITVTLEDEAPPRPQPGRMGAMFYSNDSLGCCVDMTITPALSVTGKLLLSRGALPFTGKFDATGTLTAYFGPAGAPTRTLIVKLVNSVEQQYAFTLNDNVFGGSVTSYNTIYAGRFGATNPCPAAGLYTQGLLGDAVIPQYSALSLKVNALGTATLSGKLFDGTAVLVSGPVNDDGQFGLCAPLYGMNGRLVVSGYLSSTPGQLVSSLFHLVRPGRANMPVPAPELPPVVTGFPNVTFAPYTPPSPGFRVLSVWNTFTGAGNADLSGGGFAFTTTQSLVVSPRNVVSLTGAVMAPSLKVTLNTATGGFTGSVIPANLPPIPANAKAITGVIFQGGTWGNYCSGFFLNGVTPGMIKLY
jgi:hypothetical protein